MDLCKLVIVLIVIIAIISIPLAIYLDRRDQRRGKAPKVKGVVSPQDFELYVGKHVMTDGYGGRVVASGETTDEMLAEAAALDNEVRGRLVYVYLPRRGEKLVGGQYFRPTE